VVGLAFRLRPLLPQPAANTQEGVGRGLTDKAGTFVGERVNRFALRDFTNRRHGDFDGGVRYGVERAFVTPPLDERSRQIVPTPFENTVHA